MEIAEIKEKVADIVRDELAGLPYRVFFFGSRISGTASLRSDLDLGIESLSAVPAQVPPEILRTIKVRIDSLRTLYTVDVVDFFGSSEDFKKVAKAHIEEIKL